MMFEYKLIYINLYYKMYKFVVQNQYISLKYYIFYNANLYFKMYSLKYKFIFQQIRI